MALSLARATSAAIASALAVIYMPRPRRKQLFCRCSRRNRIFELRTQSQVVRVDLDSSRKRATGVTYIDAQGRTVFQPADMVILCAFELNNTRLLPPVGNRQAI